MLKIFTCRKVSKVLPLRGRVRPALLVAFLLLYSSAPYLLLRAFPPTPPHTIFGVVRDPLGTPLSDGAEVFFEASSGTRIRKFVLAQAELPINYTLEVPMDAGLTEDLYTPTALLPAAPFRIRVRIGQTTYLPIEMSGNLSALGAAAGSTRLDLTLGVDSDGNGLPDDWEKAVAAFFGHSWESGQFRSEDSYPGTGLTYLEVYLAGTYAMDPEDGFILHIINSPGTIPSLLFTAVRGRHYKIHATDNIAEGWSPIPFRVLSTGPESSLQDSYLATETRRIEIEAPLSNDRPFRFYRLIVE